MIERTLVEEGSQITIIVDRLFEVEEELLSVSIPFSKTLDLSNISQEFCVYPITVTEEADKVWQIFNSQLFVETCSDQINDYYINFRFTKLVEDGKIEIPYIYIKKRVLDNSTPPQLNSDYKYYNRSIFAKLNDLYDSKNIAWYENVLEKTKDGGVVPTFIDRGYDFDTFWSSIAHFCSILVIFCRQFIDITKDRELLLNYLKQKDIYPYLEEFIFSIITIKNDGSTTETNNVNDLLNVYNEFRARGTVNTKDKIKALINYKNGDPFFSNYIPRKNSAWYLNSYSPLYKQFDSVEVESEDKFPSTKIQLYDAVVEDYGKDNFQEIDENFNLEFTFGNELPKSVGIYLKFVSSDLNYEDHYIDEAILHYNPTDGVSYDEYFIYINGLNRNTIKIPFRGKNDILTLLAQTKEFTDSVAIGSKKDSFFFERLLNLNGDIYNIDYFALRQLILFKDENPVAFRIEPLGLTQEYIYNIVKSVILYGNVVGDFYIRNFITSRDTINNIFIASIDIYSVSQNQICCGFYIQNTYPKSGYILLEEKNNSGISGGIICNFPYDNISFLNLDENASQTSNNIPSGYIKYGAAVDGKEFLIFGGGSTVGYSHITNDSNVNVWNGYTFDKAVYAGEVKDNIVVVATVENQEATLYTSTNRGLSFSQILVRELSIYSPHSMVGGDYFYFWGPQSNIIIRSQNGINWTDIYPNLEKYLSDVEGIGTAELLAWKVNDISYLNNNLIVQMYRNGFGFSDYSLLLRSANNGDSFIKINGFPDIILEETNSYNIYMAKPEAALHYNRLYFGSLESIVSGALVTGYRGGFYLSANFNIIKRTNFDYEDIYGVNSEDYFRSSTVGYYDGQPYTLVITRNFPSTSNNPNKIGNPNDYVIHSYSDYYGTSGAVPVQTVIPVDPAYNEQQTGFIRYSVDSNMFIVALGDGRVFRSNNLGIWSEIDLSEKRNIIEKIDILTLNTGEFHIFNSELESTKTYTFECDSAERLVTGQPYWYIRTYPQLSSILSFTWGVSKVGRINTGSDKFSGRFCLQPGPVTSFFASEFKGIRIIENSEPFYLKTNGTDLYDVEYTSSYNLYKLNYNLCFLNPSPFWLNYIKNNSEYSYEQVISKINQKFVPYQAKVLNLESGNFTTEIKPLIITGVTITNPSSIDNLYGIIDCGISGGTPPYIFYLLNSDDVIVKQQNNGYFTNILVGEYSIRVVDSIGNEAIKRNLFVTFNIEAVLIFNTYSLVFGYLAESQEIVTISTESWELVPLANSLTTITPDSVISDQTISTVLLVSTDENTGRLPKSEIRQFRTIFNQTVVVNLDILKNPKPEFVSVSNDTFEVSKDPNQIVISGSSNSTGLNLSVNSNSSSEINVSLPATYTAGGIVTNNGVEILGDPGASQQYLYIFTVQIGTNYDIFERTSTLKVANLDDSVSRLINVTQLASDAALNLDKTTITIPNTGGSDVVVVSSNAPWSSSGFSLFSVTPDSNATVGVTITNVTIALNTAWFGRLSRSEIIRFYLDSQPTTSIINLEATQQQYPEILELDQYVITIDDEAQTFTITGRSNAQRLLISISENNNNMLIIVPNVYTVNGSQTVVNGAQIANDPGASAIFTFSAIVEVNANEELFNKVAELTIETNTGLEVTYSLTQTAAPPTIELTPSTINFPYTGGDQNFTLTTDVDWELQTVAGFTTFQPSSGTTTFLRDFAVEASAEEYKGRLTRTETRTFVPSSYVGVSADLTVTQAPSALYASFVVPQIVADNTAQVIDVDGVSNAQGLTFSVSLGSFITLGSTYIANGITANNGSNISGDPGASDEYTFQMIINITANTTGSSRENTITVSAGSGITATIVILQDA